MCQCCYLLSLTTSLYCSKTIFVPSTQSLSRQSIISTYSLLLHPCYVQVFLIPLYKVSLSPHSHYLFPSATSSVDTITFPCPGTSIILHLSNMNYRKSFLNWSHLGWNDTMQLLTDYCTSYLLEKPE